jgi:hypothetical protein
MLASVVYPVPVLINNQCRQLRSVASDFWESSPFFN